MEELAPILEKFKITPATAPMIILFAIILVLILIIFIGYEIYSSRKRRKKKLKERWYWFFNYCENQDLSINEVKFLKNLSKKYFPDEPIRLLASKYELEKILYQEYEKLSDKEKESRLELIQDIRHKLRLTHLSKPLLISSSREIETEQLIKIVHHKEEKRIVIYARIIENTEDLLKVEVEKPEKAKILKEIIDEEVEIDFWSSAQAGFKFKSTIVNVEGSIIYLTHSDELECFQRRHYFRLDIHLKGKYYPLTLEEFEDYRKTGEFILKDKSKARNMKIINISGGGIAMTVPEDVEIGKHLWLEFEIDKDNNIDWVFGKIIRKKKIREGKFKYVVYFEKISEKDREKIIKFIYEKQRTIFNL